MTPNEALCHAVLDKLSQEYISNEGTYTPDQISDVCIFLGLSRQEDGITLNECGHIAGSVESIAEFLARTAQKHLAFRTALLTAALRIMS